MKFGPDLVEGRFRARLNRFLASVEIESGEVLVHVANSGRMQELFVPGWRVLLKPAAGPHRKTAYDLALVDMGFAMASADARLPNTLLAEALSRGRLDDFDHFKGYPEVRREVVFGESRLDLMLSGPNGKYYIETKSVTLVENGVGLFPDSPTLRGAKHMNSLVRAVEGGHRGAVVFVIQRPDAVEFSPNEQADPVFGAAFRMALDAGVKAFAYNCHVSETCIKLDQALPIKL